MKTSWLSPMQLSYLRTFFIISIWKLIHKYKRRKINILFTLQIYQWMNIKRRRINRCWLWWDRHTGTLLPPFPPPSSNLDHPPKIVSKRFSDDLEQKKLFWYILVSRLSGRSKPSSRNLIEPDLTEPNGTKPNLTKPNLNYPNLTGRGLALRGSFLTY